MPSSDRRKAECTGAKRGVGWASNVRAGVAIQSRFQTVSRSINRVADPESTRDEDANSAEKLSSRELHARFKPLAVHARHKPRPSPLPRIGKSIKNQSALMVDELAIWIVVGRHEQRKPSAGGGTMPKKN